MKKKQALIFGATGAIGRSLAHQLSADHTVTAIVRTPMADVPDDINHIVETDFTEASLHGIKTRLAETATHFELIINTIGLLHNDFVKPEKNLANVNTLQLQAYFNNNSIIPALLIKHFYTLLPKNERGVFATLSAKVGSIGDNQLGGWYGYRASKAALNMLIKTASIEIARTHKQAAIIAIHPGTTIGPLSAPYTKNTPADKLFSSSLTAKRIYNVLKEITHTDTGHFFNWSGDKLPW